MTVVQNKLVDAAGRPIVGATVSVELRAGRWTSEGSEVMRPWTGSTDSDGEWSVDLPPQTSYEGDTYYRVSEPGMVWEIVVPDSNTPQNVRSLLANLTSSPYHPLRLDNLADVSTSGAEEGQVLALGSAGLWVPGAAVSGGVTDHGALTGLGDDDHVQYLTTARGDGRYYTKAQVDSAYYTQAQVNAVIAALTPVDIGAAEVDAVYPLEGYGFHSASCDGAHAQVQSSFAAWHIRVWIRAGKPITKIGMVLSAAGVVGGGGLNGFAVLTDDGQAFLGKTVIDNNLWAVANLRVALMEASVPASPGGRFVRILPNVDGYISSPSVVYAVPAHDGGATLNGTGPLQRRSAYLSPFTGAFPSSINPDTLGTPTNFLPFVVVG